jgi:hypothetical protein
MNPAFTDAERAEIASVKDIAQRKLRELLADLPVDTYPFFKDCILTGGCFASLFLDEEVHDWDVYLKDSVTASRFESFVMSDTPTLNEVAGVTPRYMTEIKVKGKLVTPNAITFKNGLQVITRTGKEHRETFDFVHCMPYFDMAKQQLFISRQQYDAIKNKKLIVNPKHLLLVNQWRADKFVGRGWSFQ